MRVKDETSVAGVESMPICSNKKEKQCVHRNVENPEITCFQNTEKKTILSRDSLCFRKTIQKKIF